MFYAGLTLQKAVAETRHHRSRFMAATVEPAQDLDMRVYAADLTAEMHDIHGLRESQSGYYHAESYAESEALGKTLREAGSDGIVYDSVRHDDGECVAVFRPRLQSNYRQKRHLCDVWDGRAVTTVYEKKALD